MSQQINLFNQDLVKKRSLLTAFNLFLALLLSLLVVVGIWSWAQVKFMKQLSMETQTAQFLSNVEKQLAQEKATAKLPTHDPALANELKLLQEDLVNRERALSLLGENKFGNTVGYSDYLVAFARQIPAGVWMTGFDLEGAGDVISVHGRALQAETVPLFVSQLKREKIMQGKTFAALDIRRPLLETTPNTVGKEKKKDELAPYIEFDLHSVEFKGQKDQVVKTP